MVASRRKGWQRRPARPPARARAAEARRIANHPAAPGQAGEPQEWLDRARGGDPRAWESLVAHHRPDVVRLCRRLLGSPDEAEDAAQDCFLRAQTALESYDPSQPFRTWLLSIAAHRSIDALRRRRREAHLFESDGADDVDLHAAPAASPLEHGMAAELRAQLLGLIDAQPDRYRTALTLRYYADLDYEHIALILGVSKNQVATLLFRGRKRLRAALEDPPR